MNVPTLPRTLLASALLLSLLGLATTGCRRAVISQTRPVPVRTLQVASALYSNDILYSAAVSAKAQVVLTFKSGGYVESLGMRKSSVGTAAVLEAGDPVHKGDFLAAVRQGDYADKLSQAEGLAAQAQAGFDKASADLARAKNLLASDSITQVQFDAAKAANDSTAASLQSARAALAEARTARDDSSLRAPFDGVIVQRNIDVGALVGPANTAFILADVSSVKMTFGVPDTVVGQLALGRSVLVRSAPLPEALHGQISSIAPVADPRSRLFPVEIVIPNPDGKIKPGFVASISLPSDESRTSLTVPLSALVRSSSQANAFALFIVDTREKASIAHERIVGIGRIIGNQVVISEGLKNGENVIIQGATQVHDGDAVTVLP